MKKLSIVAATLLTTVAATSIAPAVFAADVNNQNTAQQIAGQCNGKSTCNGNGCGTNNSDNKNCCGGKNNNCCGSKNNNCCGGKNNNCCAGS